MAKHEVAFDEWIRNLPLEKRFETLDHIVKNSTDESERWDAVWHLGEIAEDVDLKGPMFDKVSDLSVWILKNDNNCVVRHEVCYQIAGRNMRKKIPDLIQAGLYDESDLVRHEAIECLAIIRAYHTRDEVKKALKDSSSYVRETAEFVLKRLDRLQGQEYNPLVETKAY